MASELFALNVDGREVGRFAELITEPSPGVTPRPLQGHELTHLVQQSGGARQTKWPPITLKRGFIEQTALMRLKRGEALALSISLRGAGARTSSPVSLLRAQLGRTVERAKGGGEVAMEELHLMHEGFQ
ncbi:MAG TPA: hypothetical protein DEH78_15425 [Solibacterales bacterium]|nr:hypothetical protein [Bryobacterales bacterium]